jgi:cytidine deaminase
MCRQTLAEFAEGDLRVLCDEGDAVAEYALGDLIPNTISLETLTDAERERTDGGDGTGGSSDDR